MEIILTLRRDNLKINVRESAEMDQADLELRATIMKVSSSVHYRHMTPPLHLSPSFLPEITLS